MGMKPMVDPASEVGVETSGELMVSFGRPPTGDGSGDCFGVARGSARFGVGVCETVILEGGRGFLEYGGVDGDACGFEGSAEVAAFCGLR